MQKIMTIVGTRPEIIRLSRIIPLLDKYCKQTLIYTNQNFDKNLSDIFFDTMSVRPPNNNLKIKNNNLSSQLASLFLGINKAIEEVKPDKVLILGDTNSCLSSIIVNRYNIKIYHMEAGNRCFSNKTPEESNRKIVDHTSSILLPYTNRSKNNLIKEGIEDNRIFVTGNPINEVINFYRNEIDKSNILKKLKINKEKYFLVTLHRAENVDNENKLKLFIDSFSELYKQWKLKIIVSTHPRTKQKLINNKIIYKKTGLYFLKPFNFFDFVKLQRNAFCVLSDSGTVQEESCILKRPNVILREVTERPETIECGSGILLGENPLDVQEKVYIAINNKTDWIPPSEYLEENVSRIVTNIILGK